MVLLMAAVSRAFPSPVAPKALTLKLPGEIAEVCAATWPAPPVRAPATPAPAKRRKSLRGLVSVGIDSSLQGKTATKAPKLPYHVLRPCGALPPRSGA